VAGLKQDLLGGRQGKPFFGMIDEGRFDTIYVYADGDYDDALTLFASISDYALTGAVFARYRSAIVEMENRLRYSAGNLYINDKTTGAFVGLQPFGGSRASGTNEKVGSRQNMTRWVSPRTVKENFRPANDYRLDLMQAP
jgi:1-pyrroline-5-carboxylate dehydrogenase